MQDADDLEGDGDGDAEGEGEDEAGADSPSNSSQGSGYESGSQRPNADMHATSPPSNAKAGADLLDIPSIRPETLTASTYDIVPTIAAPQSTSINAITATADMRWVFSGGSDGFIRRYNWSETANGKLMLTVAQRHPFVDTVVKAGVMMTYWENWDVNSRTGLSHGTDEPVVSPVYSLAAQHQGLWLLAGLESGGIRLQSIRHEEGKEIALLRQHTSAVSVLSLSSDEKSLLSGSWDKNVLDWDLNVGTVRTTFGSPAGQVSSIESRPHSVLPVPQQLPDLPLINGMMKAQANGIDQSDTPTGRVMPAGSQLLPPQAGSPDSLFGSDDGEDDLFGGSAGPVSAGGDRLAFGDDDDEFSRAIADGPLPVDGSNTLEDGSLTASKTPRPSDRPGESSEALANGAQGGSTAPLANGLPHAHDLERSNSVNGENTGPELTTTSDSTFMATSIDGTIRIWDRRQADPVARITPCTTAPFNTPLWCTSACWSPDGNFIYAGRRNGTIDEYDLHGRLSQPSRVFRFPNGSGAVTSIKPMPNSRHLVW